MGKNFFFLQNIQTAWGLTQSPIHWVQGVFPGEKWPGYHHPYPLLRLRMTGPMLLLPLDAVMAWTGKTLLYATV